MKAPPPGLTILEREKWIKEQEKKQVLRQIAIDRAIRTGKPVVLDDEDDTKESTIEEKFLELYDKMEKIYPIRTPKAARLAKCLDTVRIYLCKFHFCLIYWFTNPFLANILQHPTDAKFRTINLDNKGF